MQVLAGKAEWLATTEPQATPGGNTRILSGRVLYAVGDNQPWQLVARVTGVDGRLLVPQCASAYTQIPGDTSTVITGDPVTASSTAVIVCKGTPGHSGGIFVAALELEGQVRDGITVTVELIVASSAAR